MLAIAGTGQAQVTYSNATNFTGFGFLNGGSALQGANTITVLHADDITPTGVSNWVTQFSFSVANNDVAAQTVRARVRFWDDNAGLPGTFLTGFDITGITNAGGSGQQVFVNLLPGQFLMPTTKFWAGVAFDDDNGTLGSAGAMNNQGELIFDPPTVGSSNNNVLFTTTLAGDFFGVNNPAGSIFNFGGAAPANFLWEFTVAPEPTSCLFFAGLAALGVRGIMRHRKVV